MSIIIPAFKVIPSFFHDCLQSVASQNFEEFECLVVCSDADSFSVRSKWLTDKRFRFVSNVFSGQGPGEDRNLGLALSRGKYILFLDSDDALLPLSLTYIFETMESSNADLGLYWGCHDMPAAPNLNSQQHQTIDRAEMIQSICDCFKEKKVSPFDWWHVSTVWAKAYRREFLVSSGIRFPSCRKTEDRIFLISLLNSSTPSIRGWKEPVYFYRRHANSLSRSSRPRNALSWYNHLIIEMHRLGDQLLPSFLSLTEINSYLVKRFLLLTIRQFVNNHSVSFFSFYRELRAAFYPNSALSSLFKTITTRYPTKRVNTFVKAINKRWFVVATAVAYKKGVY